MAAEPMTAEFREAMRLVADDQEAIRERGGVTAEQRATYERLKPAADEAEARFGSWLHTHRIFGESGRSVRERYAVVRTTEAREYFDLCARMTARGARKKYAGQSRWPVGYKRLKDDGLADDRWAGLNPDRQYRIRPYRLGEGDPATYQAPCFTAIHLPTAARGVGIPFDALRYTRPDGAAITLPVVDTDWYGAMLFEAFAETDGFRLPWGGPDA